MNERDDAKVQEHRKMVDLMKKEYFTTPKRTTEEILHWNPQTR